MSEVETMRLPLLALRGLIVFPGMIINLDVGRDRSIKAVETAMGNNETVLLVTQKAAEEADPTAQDLYGFGVVARNQTDAQDAKRRDAHPRRRTLSCRGHLCHR